MNRRAKMLVADDTLNNVKLLADLLVAKDYDVATAANGEEAMTKLAAETADIVLLYVIMLSLSGYDERRSHGHDFDGLFVGQGLRARSGTSRLESAFGNRRDSAISAE